MSNCNARNGLNVTPAELMCGYLESRKGEMLDAVVTVAALVARADGWVDPLERRRLIDYLDRNGLLSLTRAEVLQLFEHRIREVRAPGGALAATHRLARCAGRSLARHILDAAHDVAAADHRLDPRENRVLELVRIALRAHALPAVVDLEATRGSS